VRREASAIENCSIALTSALRDCGSLSPRPSSSARCSSNSSSMIRSSASRFSASVSGVRLAEARPSIALSNTLRAMGVPSTTAIAPP